MPAEAKSEIVPPGPIVEVWWIDIETSVGWREHEELKTLRTAPLMAVRSVGYLVEDAPDRIVIVQSFSLSGHSERTIIPRVVVTKMLKVAPLARSKRARYGEHR